MWCAILGLTSDLFRVRENTWAFVVENCDGCATKAQVTGTGVRVTENLGKFYCGPAADWGGRLERMD
jgi:hypothetical protein